MTTATTETEVYGALVAEGVRRFDDGRTATARCTCRSATSYSRATRS